MSSSWPWHFVAVSDAEKQQRRELLTLRGYYAQLSIVIAIGLFRLVIASSSSYHRREKPTGRSRYKSWLDEPLFNGWFETRRQYLICPIWLVWLLSLSAWNTGDGE